MKVLKVKYNELHDEVSIRFSAEINECDFVTKADILSDVIHMLSQEYKELMMAHENWIGDEWMLGDIRDYLNNLKNS